MRICLQVHIHQSIREHTGSSHTTSRTLSSSTKLTQLQTFPLSVRATVWALPHEIAAALLSCMRGTMRGSSSISFFFGATVALMHYATCNVMCVCVCLQEREYARVYVFVCVDLCASHVYTRHNFMTQLTIPSAAPSKHITVLHNHCGVAFARSNSAHVLVQKWI